jgi:hypothetical protein
MQAGTAVPGVVVAKLDHVSVRNVVDALVFLVDVAEPGDWQYPIFIP